MWDGFLRTSEKRTRLPPPPHRGQLGKGQPHTKSPVCSPVKSTLEPLPVESQGSSPPTEGGIEHPSNQGGLADQIEGLLSKATGPQDFEGVHGLSSLGKDSGHMMGEEEMLI